MKKGFEDILNESNFGSQEKALINEAWQAKLSEAREEIAAQLREEFSERFEHDKGVLIESMDSFITGQIRAEIEELAEDKNKLIAERVQYKRQIKEHAAKLEQFVLESLKAEILELRQDKVKLQEDFSKLEGFVLQQLSEEIADFHKDKKALVEQRVKLVREGKIKLSEAKQKFIKHASAVVKQTVSESLRSELSALKQDIVEAKNNEFGRKIFEAFQCEFTASHLNEGTMVAKLRKELNNQVALVESLQQQVQEKQQLVESAQKEAKVSRDLSLRNEIMSELLQPLAKHQRTVISELLESVETKNLRSAFNKYLPAVLNERKSPVGTKTTLTEGRVERTGDKKGTAQTNTDNSEIVELAAIKRLAGI